MLGSYIHGKVHGVSVTDKSVSYHGSVSLSRSLLQLAGFAPYEQVHVINLNNGARWTTYLLPLEEEHAFTLNGGGARLGEIGDKCVLMTFAWSETYLPAAVVFCDSENHVAEVGEYANS